MKIVHDVTIEWPNGLGYTPCTGEYAVLKDMMNRILEGYQHLQDLTNEDYNEYCTLEQKLMNLQGEGHVGKGVPYA